MSIEMVAHQPQAATRRRAKEAAFVRFEQLNTKWIHVLDDLTPYEDLFKPEYWTSIAAHGRVNEFDRISIHPVTGEFIAELLVIQKGERSIRVVEMFRKELEMVDADNSASLGGYRVDFKGPIKKWCVVRVVDNMVMKEGLKKAQAYSELPNYHQVG